MLARPVPAFKSPTAMAPSMMSPSSLNLATLVKMVPWHHLGGSSDLKAPTIQGQPILLDLAADDTWLQISKADLKPRKVHRECNTTSAVVMLTIPEVWLQNFTEFDDVLMAAGLPYEDLKRDFGWMPMLRLADGYEGDADTGTELLAHLVLEGSVAPTILRFVTEAGVEKGTGLEFLKRQLGDSNLEDYRCACCVELQFVEVEDLAAYIPPEFLADFDESQHKGRMKSVFAKVHDALFVKPPKLSVVEFAEDRIEALVWASKRMKVQP